MGTYFIYDSLNLERLVSNTKMLRPIIFSTLPLVLIGSLINVSLYNEMNRYSQFIEEFRKRKEFNNSE